MNKRDLMIKAHKIAKATARLVGDYMVAMKLALKKVWADASEVTIGYKFVDFAKNGSRYIEVTAEEADKFKAGAKLNINGRETKSRRGRVSISKPQTAVINGIGKVFSSYGIKLVRVYLNDVKEVA